MKHRPCLLVTAAYAALVACLGINDAAAESADSANNAPSTSEAAPATSRDAASQNTDQLEEIIVTAQRRTENIQKAAIAVTAVSGEQLIRAGVADTADLTKVTPALQIGTNTGPSSQYYLRGVGNETATSLTDAAVLVNIDGVPMARSNAVPNLYFDLERIEVLKGPQGTLYGRNATGGAINLITAGATLGETSGYLTGEYGNYDSKKFTGAVNTPLGEHAAVRLAAAVSDRDGFYSDGTGDDKSQSVRLTLRAEPASNFRVILGGDYSHAGGSGSGETLNGLNRNEFIGTSDPRATALFGSIFLPLAGAFFQGYANNAFQDNRFWGVHAQAELDTSVGTLTALPSYRQYDLRYRANVIPNINDVDSNGRQSTLEIRLASDVSQKLSYILGGFVLDERDNEMSGYAGQFFLGNPSFKSKTDSYAGFARLTYNVTDTLRLTGGARYTSDVKSADIDAYSATVVCPSFLFAGVPCLGTPILPDTIPVLPIFQQPPGTIIVPWGTSGAIAQSTRTISSLHKTFNKPTYRGAVEYDVGPGSLLYASYETGFKSGGFYATSDPSQGTFKPETIDAYTIGSKNRFLDNHLQLNVEGFWWNYKNQQVSHFKTDSLGEVGYGTDNVGQSRMRGVEVEVVARPTSSLTLDATVQYLDARYRQFMFVNSAAAGPPVTGCPYTLSAGSYVIDCSNRRVLMSPEWVASGGIQQGFDLGAPGRIVLNADGRYQSSIVTGFEQLPSQLQTGYFMLDLQAQYFLPGDHFSITAFGRNVTDKAVVGFSAAHPFSAALVGENLRPPRTYGVRVDYRF